MDEKAKKELRARQLEALALKQYKVSVITMALHNFTVMGTNEQDAAQKIAQGHGRNAGKEGPVPFAHRVQDMTIITPPVTLKQVMDEIVQGQAAQANPPTPPSTLITPGDTK